MSTDKSLSPRRPRRKSSERAASQGELQIAGIIVTNADRVVYPEQGLTKGDIAKFYEEIEDWILPHVVHRPLSLLRCPRGREHECFFQKHFDVKLPSAVRKIVIQEKHKADDYVVIDDLAGLIALVQFGMLEIHPWGARDDNPERPDRLIFDLDPGEGASWRQVVQGAKDIHERLSDLGLESFLRTSGGKGLHVVLPLTRHRTWDEVKEFSRRLAADMAADDPTNYVDTMSKQERSGRVFIDYLRNSRGATAVASYSTRARSGAPVATPLRWNELDESLRPDQYTVRNLPERLQTLSSDPWEEFFQLRQSITKQMLK